MVKKILTFFCIASLSLGLYGCMSPDEKQTQDELMAYLDDVNALEKDMNSLYEQFTVLDGISDVSEVAKIYDSDIEPIMEEISQEINSIDIDNNEIMAVHQIMVDGWDVIEEALVNMYQDAQNDDYGAVDKAMIQIAEVEENRGDFTDALKELCDQYNIDLTLEFY